MKPAAFEEGAPLTLTEATVLADWEDLGASDLALTEAERQRAAAVWLWLCDPDSDDAERVRREVLTDAPLIVALAVPATEFVRWFRAADWGCFDSTERTGGEAWARGVLRRAWGACEALGALASQRAIGG